jgi:hypothetical protein
LLTARLERDAPAIAQPVGTAGDLLQLDLVWFAACAPDDRRALLQAFHEGRVSGPWTTRLVKALEPRRERQSAR